MASYPLPPMRFPTGQVPTLGNRTGSFWDPNAGANFPGQTWQGNRWIDPNWRPGSGGFTALSNALNKNPVSQGIYHGLGSETLHKAAVAASLGGLAYGAGGAFGLYGGGAGAGTAGAAGVSVPGAAGASGTIGATVPGELGGAYLGTSAGSTAATGGLGGLLGGHSSLGALSILGGTNLLGGILQNRAQGKADAANRAATEKRIREAIASLSPDHIQALIKQFLPQIAAVNNPQAQTAIQGLRQSQAMRGLGESQFGLTQEAGLRGQLANANTQQAFAQAMGLAGQQAGVYSGMPIPQVAPQTGLSNVAGNTLDQYLTFRYLSQLGGQQPQPPAREPGTAFPYLYPGQRSNVSQYPFGSNYGF